MLADLHGNGNRMDELVQLEFEQITYQVSFERNEGAKSYFDLLKPDVLHRISLGASLQMWSQLSGMNIMMHVSTHVLLLSVLTHHQVLHNLCIPRGRPDPTSS